LPFASPGYSPWRRRRAARCRHARIRGRRSAALRRHACQPRLTSRRACGSLPSTPATTCSLNHPLSLLSLDTHTLHTPPPCTLHTSPPHLVHTHLLLLLRKEGRKHTMCHFCSCCHHLFPLLPATTTPLPATLRHHRASGMTTFRGTSIAPP